MSRRREADPRRRAASRRDSRSAVAGGERAERLAVQLRERELDVLLVATPVNLRYLSGFTGTSGLAWIFAERPAGHLFLTDFRYTTQSAAQVSGAFQREIVAGDLLEGAVEELAASGSVAGRLGFDDASLTVKQHARLSELLGEEWELVPCAGLVEGLRAVKDADEIDRIRAASRLADEALRETLEAGVIGRSERDVAIELELRMRRLGAEGASFPSIVAAGGAWRAAARRAARAFDSQGRTADDRLGRAARWVLLGLHAHVRDRRADLRARPRGLRGSSSPLRNRRWLRSGRDRTAKRVDALARELIEAAGEGEHFGHGLGHGVGLEVHEGPRLSRLASEDPLRVGNVVTVEPGVYLPGRLGVRIEDLVVVTEDGQEVLTRLSKELTVVA